MNKLLAVISLTAFLCYGVQSSALSDEELKHKIVNSGTAIFIDFLDKVRDVTAKIIKDNQLKKTRMVLKEHWKKLGEHVKEINNIQEGKSNIHKNYILQEYQKRMIMVLNTCISMFNEINEQFFFPYLNTYRKTLKTKTIAGIWREVESDYLKGAPPVYSKPLGFLSYLLSKMIVKSGLVSTLKGGVDIALKKANVLDLLKKVPLLLNQFEEKAAEISSLERQKEMNDFLVSLRTASGLIVFYCNQILEHIKSLSFNEEDSMKQWAKLTRLRNPGEKYHVLIDPDTRHQKIWFWTDQTFDIFFEITPLVYTSIGNASVGYERFSQFNRAVYKIANVYGLPICEVLTKSGLGITELNRLLHRMNHALLIVEGGDISVSSQTKTEEFFRLLLPVLSDYIEAEKQKGTDYGILPMKVITKMALDFWDFFLYKVDHGSEEEFQQSERDWYNMRRMFITELIKSKEFTEDQLEEAQTNFISAIRGILEKMMTFVDMAERFDKRIDTSVLVIKKWMHDIKMQLHKIWDNMVK